MDKIKVLYIAGTGRSGSTLLERILGRAAGYFASGELTYIWENGFSEDQLCSCGKGFHECVFWGAVRNQLFDVNQHLNVEQILALKKKIERYYYIPGMLLSKGSSKPEKETQTYASALMNLYRSIQDLSQASVIVDSSKDIPYAFFLLCSMPDIDLRVIHLVRDPRGVAYSWTRKKIRPEITRQDVFMPQFPYFKTSYEWVLQNFSAGLLRKFGSRYLRIRYEDLISKPKVTLQSIAQVAGNNIAPDDIIDGQNSVTLSLNHTVSGNPSRFQQGSTILKEDDQWKREMPRAGIALVTTLTLPLLLKYGYSVVPAQSQ